jgi:hypothetical protein
MGQKELESCVNPSCQREKALPFGGASGRKRRGSNPHDRFNWETHKLYEQQEIVDPLVLHLHRKQDAPLGRYSKPLNQIPQELWHEVVRRHAGGESLRQLAKCYGVSHEAVRQVLKKADNDQLQKVAKP